MDMTFCRAILERISGTTFTECNGVKLLYRGRDSFEAIFQSVREAESFICLQFYIFRNDETGTELAEILKEKAKKGVMVYILYDHFGSLGTPGRFWDELRSAGIKIRASRPFKWSSPFHYVRRDHRKLVIVDGVKAFTGGLNIANEYRGFHLRMRGAWRDTGVVLEGPIVFGLFETFRNTWETWKGEAIPLPLRVPGSYVRSLQGGDLPVIPIFASSARGRRQMRKLLYYSIDTAHEGIHLTTAYFTPSKRMISSLEEAVKRGAEVNLLLPGKSDVPAAYYAGRKFFTRLLRAGVKIYSYQGEVLHAKSYVFDRLWSVVGSANLDFQSLRWNDEGNVGILDTGFGNTMVDVFKEDMRHSREIKEDEWLKRPLSEKIKERFFALFRRRL
ncbi:MAG TPA: phospholipase D-like domain-containing protein [Thermodesulfovibrionales bacterium]|nr:phospholipase D-like domain-containing protein [Thermodesulfovibrionales bacterium]